MVRLQFCRSVSLLYSFIAIASKSALTWIGSMGHYEGFGVVVVNFWYCREILRFVSDSFSSYCCILTQDRAVNPRFSEQDAPVKISGNCHVVERKCVGVMKWYMEMSTWDTGSLTLGVSACGQKRAFSHGSVSEWLGALLGKQPTAGLWLNIPRPRSRSVKWALEDNLVWDSQEKKNYGQWGNFHSSPSFRLSHHRSFDSKKNKESYVVHSVSFQTFLYRHLKLS